MPRMTDTFFSTQRASLCGLVLLALATPALASANASGRYGQLALAVVQDRVHGVFSEERVGNGSLASPQFSCLFLVEGRLDRDQARVVTWFPGDPERIAGTLRLGREPSLQLDGDHGGCLMTSGDMKDTPFTLFLDERRPDWIGAGIVTAPRAVLRQEPSAQSKQTRPYLVKFDTIAVLEQRPGWVRAEYLGSEGRPIRGWLRDGEVGASFDRPDKSPKG